MNLKKAEKEFIFALLIWTSDRWCHLHADWHDERSGGHSTQDESASGAIYRIAPENFKPVLPPRSKKCGGAMAALKSPNPAVRFLGFRHSKIR